MDTIVLKYNAAKPFDDYTQQVRYEATAVPVFSGCMKKNGTYYAYTQQGTLITGVSQDDCRRVIEDADRPFNYFAQQPQKKQEKIEREEKPKPYTAEELDQFIEAKKQGLI
jgi:hypothetical protein